MVRRENLVHLFIGHDIIGPDGSSRKSDALQRLKKEFLCKTTLDFNTDTLYAKETGLKDLQEVFLRIPAGSPKRMLAIKDAQLLKEDVRAYLLRYIAKPHPSLVLVLDFIPRDPNDKEEAKFIFALARHARVQRFRESRPVNTFELSRLIEAKRAPQALYVLKQLFESGQRPERILGGLRVSWQKDLYSRMELKKRLRLLLACDVDIKTGRIEPSFALERLVVYLCSLDKVAH
ncbi:MAG: hypothetical protein WC559_06055 [Candidatus Omnitrophota bacterium]